MNSSPAIRTKCVSCQSKTHTLLYPSTFEPKKHLTVEKFSARRLPDRVHGTIVKCSSCGLVRTLEAIPPQTLTKLYQKSTFTYQGLTKNLSQTYAQSLKKTLPYLRTQQSFLEIGCGNGFFLKQAKKIGFKKVAGVEPSQDAVNQATPTTRKLIINDSFKTGLFPPKSFDLIAAFQVFDHIVSPHQFLTLSHRYLKKNGLLLLFNHNVASLSARILKERSPIIDIEHPFLYSPTTLQKILSLNKFQPLVCYSPVSFISLGYLLQLSPMPKIVKQALLDARLKIFNFTLRVRLGNLAVIARKQ